jgi:hypothetical protein
LSIFSLVALAFQESLFADDENFRSRFVDRFEPAGSHEPVGASKPQAVLPRRSRIVPASFFEIVPNVPRGFLVEFSQRRDGHEAIINLPALVVPFVRVFVREQGREV